MDYILKEMNNFNADGVDFVPIMSPELMPPVIVSYTKKEWMSGNKCYPKSSRKYWNIINGQKVYCDKK